MNEQLIDAVNRNNVVAAEKFLAAGANIESQDSANWNMTPLNKAALMGSIPMVQMLIKRNANLDAMDKSGYTPLMNAINFNRFEVAEMLVNAGADISIRAGNGITALSLAEEKGDRYLQLLKSAPSRGSSLQVIFNHAAGDRNLQEIYHFQLLERITYIRKGKDGPVEAVLREPFSRLDDISGLEQAFAEHVKRSGQRTRAEVFPTSSAVKFQRK